MGFFGFRGKNKDTHEHADLSYEQQYGKLFLSLLDERTRESGYAKLAQMESVFPEAGVVVGQYYTGASARRHFDIAAAAGIAEGHWGVCGTLEHSYVPDPVISEDALWEKHCLAAAEGGCADACNEMGNVCRRRKWYIESAYWYELAMFYDHPQGQSSVHGILREWSQAGKPETRTGTANFTDQRYQAALAILKYQSGVKISDFESQMIKLALSGENLAGFFLAGVFEDSGNEELAYKIYSALSHGKNPHALRCYADMLMAGKGTNRDTASALRMYQLAAEAGNPAAMFVMGEKARNENDAYLAACWYGKAYVRGLDIAGQRLTQLKA